VPHRRRIAREGYGLSLKTLRVSWARTQRGHAATSFVRRRPNFAICPYFIAWRTQIGFRRRPARYCDVEDLCRNPRLGGQRAHSPGPSLCCYATETTAFAGSASGIASHEISADEGRCGADLLGSLHASAAARPIHCSRFRRTWTNYVPGQCTLPRAAGGANRADDPLQP